MKMAKPPKPQRRLLKMDEGLALATARELLEAAAAEISSYVVGFAKLAENHTSTDAEVAGSGTLVTIDGRDAILTAHHVIDHLPTTGEVGLIFPTPFSAQLQRPTIDMSFAQKVSIARGTSKSDGPDLALLLLPQPEAGTIRASKSFYNLSKRRDGTLSHPIRIDLGVWCLCGMVHEWTMDAAPERGYDTVKIFQGICGGGVVRTEYERNGFDYLEFEARYGPSYEGPQSFEGFSGGGLWQLLLSKSEGGEIMLRDKLFAGVAFYQSTLENGVRIIKCHGRKSIYGAVIDVMNKRASLSKDRYRTFGKPLTAYRRRRRRKGGR